MNLLALDTSTLKAALAVARGDGAIFVAPAEDDRRHGRGLIPAARNLLRGAGLAVSDLDAFAVGLGPGSYTGLRIGLTAAKTLAYAAGRPLVGLDSLEVVARGAPPEATRVSAIADAQRGDLFVADFARPTPGAPLARSAPTRVEPLSAWSARLVPGTLVVGPALSRAGFPLPDSAVAGGPALHFPEGPQLVALALEALGDGRRDDPWFLEPVYLRRSAAEDQWDARGIRPTT